MSGTGISTAPLPPAVWHRRTVAPARKAREAPLALQAPLFSLPPRTLRAVLEQHSAGVEILADPIGFGKVAALARVLAGVDQALDLVDRDRRAFVFRLAQ